jgi:hypothetical protein
MRIEETIELVERLVVHPELSREQFVVDRCLDHIVWVPSLSYYFLVASSRLGTRPLPTYEVTAGKEDC